MPSEELLHRSESMGGGLREHEVLQMPRSKGVNNVKNFINHRYSHCMFIHTVSNCIFLQPGYEAHQRYPATFSKTLR